MSQPLYGHNTPDLKKKNVPFHFPSSFPSWLGKVTQLWEKEKGKDISLTQKMIHLRLNENQKNLYKKELSYYYEDRILEQLPITQYSLYLKSWIHNPWCIPSILTSMPDLKISKWKPWDWTQSLESLEYSITVWTFGANPWTYCFWAV